MFLCLATVSGQHTSGEYKLSLSQYGLKGKVKTLVSHHEYGFLTRDNFNEKDNLLAINLIEEEIR